MKAIKLCLLGLAALYTAFATGCGDTIEPGDNGTSDGDADSDTDSDADSDIGNIDVSECTNPANTGNLCQDRMDAGQYLGCVASFDALATNQAGNDNVGYDYIGFYAYNDMSETGVMIPEVNPDGVGMAKTIKSCGVAAANYALYMNATGWTGWGAGLGMDWGGPHNDNCDVTGAQECLNIGIVNPKFALETAAADPLCQGDNAEAKLDCLKRGKIIKETKDLTGYRGLGFWIMVTDIHKAGTMKVTFPIPATVRFYGGETGCNDDDNVDTNDCFNDYYKPVPLPATPFKWEYREVLFNDVSWDTTWGLQLTGLGYTQKQFPVTESIGIKFQIDSPYNDQDDPFFPVTEMYIDDITLLPNVK